MGKTYYYFIIYDGPDQFRSSVQTTDGKWSIFSIDDWSLQEVLDDGLADIRDPAIVAVYLKSKGILKTNDRLLGGQRDIINEWRKAKK